MRHVPLHPKVLQMRSRMGAEELRGDAESVFGMQVAVLEQRESEQEEDRMNCIRILTFRGQDYMVNTGPDGDDIREVGSFLTFCEAETGDMVSIPLTNMAEIRQSEKRLDMPKPPGDLFSELMNDLANRNCKKDSSKIDISGWRSNDES